ncbi:MAG: 6-phosphogluconolactonase [Planctomycetota bacterium]|nr:6-phosphogluconolactonase [Planctomycetota bacterium]
MSRPQLDRELGDRIAHLLQQGVESRGYASLVVSGGSTPKGLFQVLSRKSIEWEKVHVTLADERWVEVDSDQSNERFVRENLLQNRARTARFLGLMNDRISPEEGCAQAISRLREIARPFDVVILGMGEDGHTCSWFPCSDEIDTVLTTREVCVPVNPFTVSDPRLTISMSGILESRQIIVHIVGENKWFVYRKALKAESIQRTPISAVLRQTEVPVDVYWSV